MKKIYLAVAITLTFSKSLAAVPNAGQVMRDIEQERKTLPAPADLAPEMKKTTKKSNNNEKDDAPRILVHGFLIEGNRVLKAPELLKKLKGFSGKKLALKDLQDASQIITQYYQEKGYVLARAYLPEQDVTGGWVRITIAEGNFGQLHLNNRTRVSSTLLRKSVAGIKNGQVISDTDLERGLLLLSDIPGIEVNNTLRPGNQPGTADLLVDTTPGPLFSGSLTADNYGERYTGNYRLGGNLSLNNPLGLGDQASLRLLGSNKHQQYYRAAYDLPVYDSPVRVGAAHSEMSYRLGEDFAVLNAHGRAEITSLYAAYPVIRARLFNLSVQLQYEDKKLRDDIDLFEKRSKKDVGLSTLTLNLNNQDRWFGGGQSVLSISYGLGRLNIGDKQDRLWDAYSAKTLGSFSKININALRLQNLGGRFQWYTQINAQWASNNLDASEKFSLGGPYGVRAYDAGSGNGDEGIQFSTELRYAVMPGWQLRSFLDHGAIKLNKQPWTSEKNTARLTSVGAGIGWFGRQQQVNIVAAWPIAQENAVTAPTHTPRVWLQTSWTF
ncbi:ShlB/FhaC/HecB family hemolysin secretion/activation protein [Serratia plymuthica]|uniref:ShlB/FhaC/HecB family hemolysin secretion/activation protein n=1 Tax=Serratia plymuthica TaxID=82996 RepID=UPI0004567A23|nr:ShlB/FhaC/HecB family hemolysin secretion/activation protein [Serratia plymuthica]AHY09702.1 membrane protein [Serratia plymuthica]